MSAFSGVRITVNPNFDLGQVKCGCYQRKFLLIDLVDCSCPKMNRSTFTDSCMHRWMTMSRIPSRRATGFESTLKFLSIDEQVVRSQQVVNGRKLGEALTFAFYGNQKYAENFRGCISKFLTALVNFRLKLKNLEMEDYLTDCGLILSEDKGGAISQLGLWQGNRAYLVGDRWLWEKIKNSRPITNT